MSHHVSAENETHLVDEQPELLAAKPSLQAPFAVSNKRKRTGTAQKTGGSCEGLLPFHAVLQWTAATFSSDSCNLKLSQSHRLGSVPQHCPQPERPITRSRLSRVSLSGDTASFPITCPLEIPLWVYYRIVQGGEATCPIFSNWKQEDLQAVGRLKEKRAGVQGHPQLPETLLKQKQTKQGISKAYN